MGGEIRMTSSLGIGSTFWFTARFEKQEPANTASEPTGDLSGTRILIVDDNAANRNILKHQTSSWGMIVSEAESGLQALELLRSGVAEGKPYDVAALDQVMPDMDGFQLAESIKSDPAIASVLLVLLPSSGQRGHGRTYRNWRSPPSGRHNAAHNYHCDDGKHSRRRPRKMFGRGDGWLHNQAGEEHDACRNHREVFWK